MTNKPLRARVDELATEVARLRRYAEPETSLAFLADRMSGHVESLAAMLEPSAGELVAWTAPGDDEAVREALRIVDERRARLRARLGYREAA